MGWGAQWSGFLQDKKRVLNLPTKETLMATKNYLN
jgi:hypothetical protein